MKVMKFSMAMFVVMFAFLASCGLQAKKGFLESCSKEGDCKKGLKCSPVSTLAKNKICKRAAGEKCTYDTDCGSGLICKDHKKGSWYCMTGCISEANCI